MPICIRDRSAPPVEQRRGSRGLPAALLALAALVFVSVLGYLHWLDTTPPPEPDTRSLPQPNGYDAFRAALARLRVSPRDSPLRRPREQEAERLRGALIQDRAGLDELRRSLRLDYMSPHHAMRGTRGFPPVLVEEAAARFAAEACVARADGNPAAALDRALDAVELGSRIGRGAALSANLLGIDCIVAGGDQAESCLDLSAAQARAAGQRIERILKQLTPYAAAVREEWLETLADLRLRLLQDPPASPAAAVGTGVVLPPHGGIRRLWYSRRRAYAAMDRYFEAALAMAEHPYWNRPPVPQPDPDEVWGLMPNPFRQRGIRWEGASARLRLLRLELALREFHQRHGRWPDRLEQLDRVVPAVLEDPFAPAPLCYRRAGSGYRLYSRGPDGRDDGGRAIRTELIPGIRGDLVAGHQWPPRPPW